MSRISISSCVGSAPAAGAAAGAGAGVSAGAGLVQEVQTRLSTRDIHVLVQQPHEGHRTRSRNSSHVAKLLNSLRSRGAGLEGTADSPYGSKTLLLVVKMFGCNVLVLGSWISEFQEERVGHFKVLVERSAGLVHAPRTVLRDRRRPRERSVSSSLSSWLCIAIATRRTGFASNGKVGATGGALVHRNLRVHHRVVLGPVPRSRRVTGKAQSVSREVSLTATGLCDGAELAAHTHTHCNGAFKSTLDLPGDAARAADYGRACAAVVSSTQRVKAFAAHGALLAGLGLSRSVGVVHVAHSLVRLSTRHDCRRVGARDGAGESHGLAVPRLLWSAARLRCVWL
ncbi:hypothetical protein GQ600_21404 [Phytophthora cactorum]|nr:hypothetical protein GQ600_21404 [Phytophthora cactorum]